jgi:cysteine synthase A
MPEDMSEERRTLLAAYGARIVLTPAGRLMAGAVERAEELRKEHPDWYLPGQFTNRANPESHKRTTAPEIDAATEGRLDAFVAGVGTGGTLTGVGEYFKEKGHPVRIVAVEPEKSPVLSGGKPRPHRIQGIGAGFVPPVLNRAVLDEVLTVTEEESYRTAKRLAREEGLLVGISTGANVATALKVAARYGPGKRVVTLCCDMGERYFSLEDQFERDLFKDGI